MSDTPLTREEETALEADHMRRHLIQAAAAVLAYAVGGMDMDEDETIFMDALNRATVEGAAAGELIGATEQEQKIAHKFTMVGFIAGAGWDDCVESQLKAESLTSRGHEQGDMN